MKNRILLGLDALLCSLVVFVAFTARFEGLGWLPAMTTMALAYAAMAIPTKLIVFWRVGLYGRLWRYASIADLEITTIACTLGALVSFAIGIVAMPALRIVAVRVPIGILLVDSLLTAAVVTQLRLGLRIATRRGRRGRNYRPQLYSSGNRKSRSRSDLAGNGQVRADVRRILIVGAGHAGGMIIKELLENQQLDLAPVGFLDDDIAKHGHRLHGLPVVGAISDLENVARRLGVGEVIVALPSAGGKVIRDIVQRASAVGVRTRTVPGLYEIITGAKAVSALRPIQIEDLLRRDPIATNLEQVSKLVTGRTVFVTGAGGSIGRELCRQLARLSPTRIVAVGRGENSVFELLEELGVSFPEIDVTPAIVDVRDCVRMRATFDASRPFSVFHAAAHKHVSLMEASVDEAILNNVLGTRNVAELCGEFGVEHMVLISTDKAVRPTSVMGATKRIAERTLCSVAERTRRSFVSVRFGNVLGSRGSVVPTFLRQIAAGGPVTITHRDMRRYFMTIPEAVQLVLQAAALGRGGEVFVLDMGDPVRIKDLAEDLIRLSGLEIGSDVDICYTGVRPGEKLYEELFFGPNDATPTTHPKILRARDGSASADVDCAIDRLIEAARRRDPEPELRVMIQAIVPEYRQPVIADNAPELIDAPTHSLPGMTVGVTRQSPIVENPATA